MSDFPRVVASERIFEGRVFGVRVDELQFEDEARVHRLDVVEHRISLAIVATPSPGQVVLVRQYRHPAGRALWEVPAGTAEPGEDPLTAAVRELREETGYRASAVRPLEALYSTPGFCEEVMYFYLAEGLQPGAQALDEDERIEVATVSLADAWNLVARGEIADCKTVLALLWLESGRGEVGGGFDR